MLYFNIYLLLFKYFTMLWLFLLINIIRSSTIPQLPQKFALMTVTHSRTPQNQFFKSYLKRYAEMDCNVVSEIAIIWNNKQRVETTDIMTLKSRWKRPVYFHHSELDSMSLRFRIPADSKSQVYFVIDDDIEINCQELQHGFKIWQQKSVSTIAPLVGYVRRNHNFGIEEDHFQYYPQLNTPYYTFILVGAAFISRQYLEFFNSNSPEPFSMYLHSQKIKNCDDLMMNFLITKYYPYFTSTYITPLVDPQTKKPMFVLHDGPNGVSRGTSHFIVRHQCLRIYSLYLGQIPLKIYKVNETQIRSTHWQFPQKVLSAIIQLSREGVSQKLFPPQINLRSEQIQIKSLNQNIPRYLIIFCLAILNFSILINLFIRKLDKKQ